MPLHISWQTRYIFHVPSLDINYVYRMLHMVSVMFEYGRTVRYGMRNGHSNMFISKRVS